MKIYEVELDMAEPAQEMLVDWMQKHGIDRQLVDLGMPTTTFRLRSLRREALESFIYEWYDSGDDETNRLCLDDIKEITFKCPAGWVSEAQHFGAPTSFNEEVKKV